MRPEGQDEFADGIALRLSGTRVSKSTARSLVLCGDEAYGSKRGRGYDPVGVVVFDQGA